MATITIPPGVDAEARRTIIFTPTAGLSKAVLEGATAVALTCYLSKNTFGESAETERGTDERECTKIVFEVLGKTRFTLENLDYVWDPQAPEGDENNKAYETLKPGTKGFITIRYGVEDEEPLEVDQKADQFPVTLGEQVRKTPEGNAGEKLKISQEVVVTGVPVRDGIIAA